MVARYTPFVPAALGSSITFEAANAAEVAEKIMQNKVMREKLNLTGGAGYILHGLNLGKAESTKDGLTRKLKIQWQAMQTLPQQRKNEHNPIETKTIYMEHGVDDEPETEWEWVADSKGKLNACVKGKALDAHGVADGDSKSEAPKTEYVVKSQATTHYVNEAGLAEIKEFLAANHTKGGDHFTHDMLRAWAADAEFSLAEGNSATIELAAWDSVHGRTQTFTISEAGLDANTVEIEDSLDVQEAADRAVSTAQRLGIGVDENSVADVLATRKGPDKGSFIGKIVGVDGELGLVYQSTGQGKGVALPIEKLSREVTVGAVESISFKDGVGTVADRSQSLGKGR